ncbi:MAG TPA: hypothetical protein VF601_23395 [Beijerinckiaceae bacterium]|jgi:hypothetical protein
MHRERVLIDAQHQLVSGTCLADLLRTRANLHAALPDCRLITLLDDKIAHLRASAARRGEPARRRELAFPSL